MNINKENGNSYFKDVMECKNDQEVVSKTEEFIKHFDPAATEIKRQITQVKNRLKNRAKEVSGRDKEQIDKEIKKVENISRSLVFYKKIEKEYGEDLANT